MAFFHRIVEINPIRWNSVSSDIFVQISLNVSGDTEN